MAIKTLVHTNTNSTLGARKKKKRKKRRKIQYCVFVCQVRVYIDALVAFCMCVSKILNPLSLEFIF